MPDKINYGTQPRQQIGRQGSLAAEPQEPDASPNLSHDPCRSSSVARNGADDEAASVQRRRGFREVLHDFYERNFGLFLVFAAQTFGSVMNTAAKLLTAEDSPNRFHALHIIFVRMSATAIIGFLYMWYKKVPDSPFGPRNVLGLLILRGTCGFFGLLGAYYSLSYLEISDATAITFLVPTWTAILCYVWLKESYRIQEALSGLISLSGVLLIARPSFLFGSPDPVSEPEGNATARKFAVDGSQRALAVLAGILGSVTAAMAYSTIRVIGTRAHSLICVNYFAMISTVGSTAVLLIHPDLHFILPRGTEQWILIFVISISGFLLQFLLTEGLQREKGGRATNMMYFQMVLVLIIERAIWGTTPPALSLIGSALIISGAIWLSLQKPKPKPKPAAVVDEETNLLGAGRRQAETEA